MVAVAPKEYIVALLFAHIAIECRRNYIPEKNIHTHVRIHKFICYLSKSVIIIIIIFSIVIQDLRSSPPLKYDFHFNSLTQTFDDIAATFSL